MPPRLVRVCLTILLVLLLVGLVVGGGGHSLTHADGHGQDCVLCHAFVLDLPRPVPVLALLLPPVEDFLVSVEPFHARGLERLRVPRGPPADLA